MSPTPAQPQQVYYEEPALYVFDQALLASATITDLSRTIDRDSDFLLARIHGTQTGSYTISVKLPNGRPISNTPVANANLVGTAANPVFIGPPILYIAGSRIAIDLTDTSAAPNNIEIVFAGVRRYRIGG